MQKTFICFLVAGTMAFFLLPACAEDSKVSKAPEKSITETEDTDVAGEAINSIMDQPVNFSTPEDVEKSFQKIKEQKGEAAYKQLKSALAYIKYYDLSIGNSDEKLYKKLNGQTPNAIIAKTRR